MAKLKDTKPRTAKHPRLKRETKRAEQALKDSELRYRRLFETAQDGIFLLEFTTGQITDANPFVCALLGYTRHELLGKQLWEIGSLRHVAASKDAFLELQANEYIRYDHLPLETKDQRHIDVEFVSNVYQVNGTKVIQCNIRDITARKRTEAELQRAEEKFSRLLEAAPDAMVIVDHQGKIRFVSSQTEMLFGYRREELYGRTIEILLPERFRANHIGDRRNYFVDPKTRLMGKGLELYGLHKDGTEFSVDISLSPLHTKEGDLVTAAIRDSSERKRGEASRSQLAAIVESSDDAIISKTLDGRIVSWNDGAEHTYGYTADEVTGHPISILLPADRPDEMSQILDRLRRGERVKHYETVHARKDGRKIDVSLTVSPIRTIASDEIIGASIIARDVTEQKRAEEYVRYLAQHDTLTGLPNRLLFRDRIVQAIAQARRNQQHVAVAFIDLDRFKEINDSLGHEIGDQLLSLAAKRLQDCLREGDTVARLGGDEFVVSLPELINPEDALSAATKILEALREPFLIDTHELHVSGSIGISLYPSDGADADTLMRAADTAMYHAKENGRDNCQFFTKSLNDAAQRRLLIASRLHQAVKHGEFFLHYQPQINLENGRIFACEALLRWQQPELGLISPNEFITVAEEMGLIVPIGEWVLRQACEQLKRWRSGGYPSLCIAVNISPIQLRRPAFPELVSLILHETDLPPEALVLELTESVLTMQSSENFVALEQIASMGIGLAVDDFGTGYSSLTYVQRFPITILKIDQSFIDGIGSDEGDIAIVAAIIAMAQSLRLQIIAEGVETIEQANFLKAHGCLAAQGFHYNHAISAEALTELLHLAEQPKVS